MKYKLCFNAASTLSLAVELGRGFDAYAMNLPRSGSPSTLWLRLCDGCILRVGVEMHDLSDWEEIGTLTFEVVRTEDAPEMVSLSASWSSVREVQKLVFSSDECEAECGFVLCTSSGDQLVVVPGADVYTLAIKAPFFSLSFTPEMDLTAYVRRPL